MVILLGEHIGFAECLGVILAYLRYSLLYSTVFRRATDEICGFDWAILGHSPLFSSVPPVIIVYFVWDHSRSNELSKKSFFYLTTLSTPWWQNQTITWCRHCLFAVWPVINYMSSSSCLHIDYWVFTLMQHRISILKQTACFNLYFS